MQRKCNQVPSVTNEILEMKPKYGSERRKAREIKGRKWETEVVYRLRT